MLLAMTSSWRSSVVCRESPMRSAFSIGGSPLHDRFRTGAALPSLTFPDPQSLFAVLPNRGGLASHSAKAVPTRKVVIYERVGNLAGSQPRGRKVLLTMFA